MLKSILVVMSNGVQFEVTNVVEHWINDENMLIIKEQGGVEHHINKARLDFMSIKSAIETPKLIT